MAQVHPPRSHAIRSRVRSFSRAGGRLTDSQVQAMAEHGEHYVIQVPRADAIRTVAADFRLDPQEVFGHVGQVRPVVVEVGSGGGEALLAHAAANPGTDHLAVEVWETSIAKIVRDAAKAGLDNVRVVPADASQLLRGGGVWRLATDWADYAWQMRDVLEDVSALPEGLEADMTEPYFRYDGAGRLSELGADTWEQDSLGNGPDPGSPSGTVGGWSPRFEGRVLTRFEQRGIEAGRTIRDLTAVRTETTWKPERSEAMLVALDRRAGTRREARSGRSLA